MRGIARTLRRGLDAGAVIIFAQCGLPYFSSGWFGNLLEHSDFERVKDLLESNSKGENSGRSYADVSALCTPMRKALFPKVAKLPAEYLLFGSDFPTPAFELFADEKEVKNDFKAVMAGHFERAIIPQDNLLDVNYWHLRQAFPGHPLFTNFAEKLAQG